MQDARDLDPQDRPIFGAVAIGRALGLNARQAYYAIEMGHLDEVVSKFWRAMVFDAASLTADRERHHQGGKRLNQNR